MRCAVYDIIDGNVRMIYVRENLITLFIHDDLNLSDMGWFAKSRFFGKC